MSKKHIIDAMKYLYNKNYISIRDGNISYKPKNEKYFYISAGGVKKNEMNEQQVIKILFNNNGDLDYYKKYKYLPSKEIFMHSILQTDNYYFDKNIFIVHAHPQNIISYMGIEKSKELDTIKNIFPELNVGNIGKNVKYQEAGSIELANECYNKLKYNDIIGLERHGTLSIGEDIDIIHENIETLDYYINIIKK
tara:strand:+ start:4550 stop:5131 length:582 start_codon:yes stop_codon:yes gene_type:complete